MAEKTSAGKQGSHSDLEIEPKLLEDIRSIVERRDFIQDLMAKATTAEAGVKPAIRTKVIGDYEQRLQGVMTELEPVCEQISRALSDIEKREVEIRTKLEEVTDAIEEQRFRCELGEFSKAELEPREKEQSKVRDELQEKIGVIEATYGECKKYLSQETFERAVGPGPQVPAPAPAPETPVLLTPKPQGAPAQAPTQAPAKGGNEGTPAVSPAKPVSTPIPVPKPPTAQAEEPTTPGMPAAPSDAPAPMELSPKGKAATPPPPPAADKAQPPRIKVVTAGAEPQIIPLTREKTIIGRHQSSDIVLRVAGVSRKHAEITLSDGGEVRIEDVSSGGGFNINGKRQKKSKLKAGDVITIGPYTLELLAD